MNKELESERERWKRQRLELDSSLTDAINKNDDYEKLIKEKDHQFDEDRDDLLNKVAKLEHMLHPITHGESYQAKEVTLSYEFSKLKE